jgi:hypothetical protein
MLIFEEPLFFTLFCFKTAAAPAFATAFLANIRPPSTYFFIPLRAF